MTEKDEYLRQSEFRSWDNYLNELPSNDKSNILDLGCGLGTVTRLLGRRYSVVIGIDSNTAFINDAINVKQVGNVSFINADLRKIIDLRLPKVDGIWCSFTAAYFPDLDEVFQDWIRLLNPGGWLALIEVNDLFNHSPLSEDTRRAFADHYKRLYTEKQYDFLMGAS